MPREIVAFHVHRLGSSTHRWCSSSSEALHLLRERAVLAVLTEHPLRAVAARHAAEDHAVEQRVATEAVVAVHTARDLARRVQTTDHTARGALDLTLRVDLQPTHAVVDGRRDDRDAVRVIERGRQVWKNFLPHGSND